LPASTPPPSFPTRRSSDLVGVGGRADLEARADERHRGARDVEVADGDADLVAASRPGAERDDRVSAPVVEASTRSGRRRRTDERDRKSTRLNSSHVAISYA